MAKKPTKPPAVKATAAKRQAAKTLPAAPGSFPPNFLLRWTELAGEALKPGLKLPARAISSIATFRAAPPAPAVPAGPVGLANPLVVCVVRDRKGSGCGKMAEIGGFYEKTFPAGAPVILGPVAVKAILDTEAAKVCCQDLQCPPECPCQYLPQNQLAKYVVTATSETGYLLQDASVWNCRCRITG